MKNVLIGAVPGVSTNKLNAATISASGTLYAADTAIRFPTLDLHRQSCGFDKSRHWL